MLDFISLTTPAIADFLGPRVGKRALATRIELLKVSERLFADHGVAAVSLRQIAQEAGHSNSNVVQYHLKSKENLISALIYWRSKSMEVRRLEMLVEAENQGRIGDMQALLEIVCLPILDAVDDRGFHSFARVLNDYMFRLRPMGMLHPSDGPEPESPVMSKLLALIVARLHYLAPEVAKLRARICVSMFVQNIVALDYEARSLGHAVSPPEAIADNLAMMTCAMMAPPPPLTGRTWTTPWATEGIQ